MKKSHKKILIGAGAGIGAIAVISTAIGVTLATTKKEAIPFNLKITAGNSRLNLNFNGTDRATYGLARVKVQFYDKSGKPVADTTVPLRANAFQKGVFVAGLKLDSNTEYTYRVLSTDAVATTLFEGTFTTGTFKKSDNRVVELVEADIESEDVTLDSIGITVFYGATMKNAKGTIKVTYISSDDQEKIKESEATATTTTDTDNQAQPSNNASNNASNNTSNNTTSNNTTPEAPATPTPTVKEFPQQDADKQIIKLENLERGKNYNIKVDYIPSSSVIQPISLFEGYVKTQDPNFDFLFNEASEEKEQEYLLNINDIKNLLLDSSNKLTLFHKKQDSNRWSKFALTNSTGGQFDIQKEIISGNSTDPFLFYDFKLEWEKSDGTKVDLIPLKQTVLLNPAQFSKFNVDLENPKLVELNNKVLRTMDHDKPTRHNTFAVMFDQIKTRQELDFFNNFLKTTKVFSNKVIDDVLRYMGSAVTKYINTAYNKQTWNLDANNKGPSDAADANKKGYWASKHIWFQHPTHENYPFPYILIATKETTAFLSTKTDTSQYTLGALDIPSTPNATFRGDNISFRSFWDPNPTPSVDRSGYLLGISRTVWSNQSDNSMIHDRLTAEKLVNVFKFAFGSRVFEANHSFELPEPTMVDGDAADTTASSNTNPGGTDTPPAPEGGESSQQPPAPNAESQPGSSTGSQPGTSGTPGGTGAQPPAPDSSSSSSSATTPAPGNTTAQS